MARKRRRSLPPPANDHDLKRPLIIGIVQAFAREVAYAFISVHSGVLG
jgi:hypothetical protein